MIVGGSAGGGLWVRRSPTDDPLGPVAVDADTLRDTACELTVADDLCSAPEPGPFLPPPGPGPTGSGTDFALGDLLVVLLVVGLVIAIAWLIVLIVRNRVPAEDEPEVDEPDVDLDEPVEQRRIDRDRSPDRWRRAAEEHRAAGRFREAIRCEYRALVGDLARAGIVDEIPGRTSGEERRQVHAVAPSLASEFDVAADRFDEAWFGAAPVDRADDERFLAAARSMLAVVLAGTGGRGERR